MIAQRYGFIAICLCFSVTPTLAAEASSSETLAILTKNACLSCHRVDKKLLGPSFRAIAEVAPPSPERAEHLKHQVRRGSQGVWGPVAMPPNQKLSDSELEQVIQWILSGAPED